MPDDKLPPVFIPITLEPGGIVEPAAPVEASITEPVISARLEAQTRAVLSTLTPNEERVLRMRFGIGEANADAATDGEEVGQDFEVTRQRIREIEAKALRKLRERQEAREGAASTADESESDDDDEPDDD